MVRIRQLEAKAGTIAGAGALFEQMLIYLLKLKHSSLRSIRPAPGDWGIDAYIGELTSSEIWVWQSKYFVEIGAPQQNQIRGSFAQVIKKAKAENFDLKIWALCIPIRMSGDETKWWESWKKKTEKENNITIKLYDETDLGFELLSPDAKPIYEHYFGTVEPIVQEKKILVPKDVSIFDNSIFIKKLALAGIKETISARTQFFNAELLKNEILKKGTDDEKQELTSIYEKIRSKWETKYTQASLNDAEEIPKIYPELLSEIEKENFSSLRTIKVPASFVHKQGLMHQLADICEIGWTKDYKKLDEHYESH